MSKITRNLIIDTFLRLLDEKEVEKITVKEIVTCCGINRNTFYYHFKDLYDLLDTMLRLRAQEVKEACIRQVPWQENLLRSLSFAIAHKNAFFHLCQSKYREPIENYLFAVIGEVMKRYIFEQAEGMEIEQRDLLLVADFYKYALVGVLLEWMRSDMCADPQEIIHKVGILFDGNIGRALLQLKQERE